MIKIRVDNHVLNKSIHLALEINLDGEKKLLVIWCNTTESAKFWLSALTEKNRKLLLLT